MTKKAKRRRATVGEVLDLCVDLQAAGEKISALDRPDVARGPLADRERERAARDHDFAYDALCGLDLVELRDRVRKAER